MFADSVRHFWLPMALATQLESRPRQFRLLGENLVAYRDSAGPVVFKDQCRHRGAALSNGWLIGGNLTCPYHGWQYDRSGMCVAIPSLLPGERIPSNAKAVAYQATELYGLIWVCMSPQPPRLPEWPDEAWSRSDFRVFCTGEYLWHANAARVIENGLDFSHFNFAHKGLTELADGPMIKPHRIETRDDRLSMTYEDGGLSREYTVEYPFVLHIRKRVIRVDGTATWSSNDNSKINDITTVTLIASPVADEQTRMFGFLSRNHSLDTADHEFASSFNSVLEQDRVIVESQTPKMIPQDIASELHVRHADIASIAYRRMFKVASEKRGSA